MPKLNQDGDSSPFEGMIEGSEPSRELEVTEDDANVPAVATTWTQTPVYEPHEVAFPRLRLGQGLTPEVAEGTAKMGQWIIAGYEAKDEVTVIPLMMGRTRLKRKDPSDRESPVACQSPDGEQGHGDPGIACKVCPHSKFRPGGPNGKNLPPECTLTYRYAVWVDEFETIAEMTFQRTSEKVAYTINSCEQKFKYGNFAFVATASYINNGTRRFMIPQLRLTPITPAMRARAGNLLPGSEVSWEDEPSEDADILDGQAVPF